MTVGGRRTQQKGDPVGIQKPAHPREKTFPGDRFGRPRVDQMDQLAECVHGQVKGLGRTWYDLDCRGSTDQPQPR